VRTVSSSEPFDPFMDHLGIRVVSSGSGRVTMEIVPGPEHLNLGGIVHGGLLSTLMDSATGWALHTTLPEGSTPPHLAVAYRFLSMAHPGVTLRAEATVLKTGARIGHVRVEVLDASDRLIATGETTHAIVAVPG
jgi:acyl-CoA thioesterase